MSSFDIAVLGLTLIAIVFFGVWKTRNDRKLDEFLKGSSNSWAFSRRRRKYRSYQTLCESHLSGSWELIRTMKQ